MDADEDNAEIEIVEDARDDDVVFIPIENRN
jgi:hypothetical protein